MDYREKLINYEADHMRQRLCRLDESINELGNVKLVEDKHHQDVAQVTMKYE